jgi:hypothetical protein
MRASGRCCWGGWRTQVEPQILPRIFRLDLAVFAHDPSFYRSPDRHEIALRFSAREADRAWPAPNGVIRLKRINLSNHQGHRLRQLFKGSVGCRKEVPSSKLDAHPGGVECPSWVKTGPRGSVATRPLSCRKQPSFGRLHGSHKCQERPFAGGDGIAVRGHADSIAEGRPTRSGTRTAVMISASCKKSLRGPRKETPNAFGKGTSPGGIHAQGLLDRNLSLDQ